MAEYQRAIDEIQAYVQSRNWAMTPAIRAAAPPYAQACQEANQRLSQCSTLIRQGLEVEAIHLAQAEPKLLDLVAELDFSEREQWQELASANGLPAPGGLNLEAAELINKTFAKVYPLEKLLRLHRIKALARADLRLRIETMRELATLDPTSPVWKEDIAVFEKARFSEIENELKKPLTPDDREQVKELDQELRNTAWSIPVPAALKTRLTQLVEKWEKQAARTELEQVQKLLVGTHAALDVERGQTLRINWGKLSRQIGLEPKDPLAVGAASALKWLDREDAKAQRLQEFNEAIEDLEHALSAGSTLEDLEKCYEAVKAFQEYEVSRELVGRVYREITSRKNAAGAKRKRIVISVSLLAVACLLGTGYVIWSNAQSNALSNGAADMARFLDNDNPEEARKVFDQLNADPHDNRELAAVFERLVDAENREKKRSADFNDALELASKDPIPPIKSPHLEAANGLWLRRKSQADKSKMDAVAEDRKQRINDWVTSSNFEGRLKAAKDLVVQLRSGADIGRAGLDNLENEAQKLRTELSNGPELLHQQAETLWNDVVAGRNETNALREKSSTIQEVTRASCAVNRIGEYSSLLEKLNRIAPNEDFGRALREKKVWEDVTDWSKLVFAAGPVSLGEIGPAKAQKLIQLLESGDRKYPTMSASPAASEMKKCLVAMANQTEADDALRKFFSKKTVSGLWVHEEDSLHYYMSEKAKDAWKEAGERNNDPVNLSIRMNFNGDDKNILRRWPKGNPPKPAAHSRIAHAFLDKGELADGASGKWDSAVIDLIGQIRNDREMDPLLRLWFLRMVLLEVGKGGPFLQKPVAEIVKKIDSGNISFSNNPWMAEKETQGTRELRSKATAVLNNLPPTDNLQHQVDQARASVEREFNRLKLTPTGWLHKNGANKWEGTSEGEAQSPGEVCLVYPTGDAVTYVPIGKLQPPHRIDLDEAKSSEFVEGRLIFVRGGPR